MVVPEDLKVYSSSTITVTSTLDTLTTVDQIEKATPDIFSFDEYSIEAILSGPDGSALKQLLVMEQIFAHTRVSNWYDFWEMVENLECTNSAVQAFRGEKSFKVS